MSKKTETEKKPCLLSDEELRAVAGGFVSSVSETRHNMVKAAVNNLRG